MKGINVRFVNCLKHSEFILFPTISYDKWVSSFKDNKFSFEKTLTIGWLCWFVLFSKIIKE